MHTRTIRQHTSYGTSNDAYSYDTGSSGDLYTNDAYSYDTGSTGDLYTGDAYSTDCSSTCGGDLYTNEGRI